MKSYRRLYIISLSSKCHLFCIDIPSPKRTRCFRTRFVPSWPLQVWRGHKTPIRRPWAIPIHFIMCPQSLIGSLESGHYSGPLRVILKNRYLWMLAAPLAWLCTSYRTRALIKPLRAIVPVKAAYKMSVRSYLHPYFLSAYLSTQNLRMTLNIHISPSNRRHETNINSTT